MSLEILREELAKQKRDEFETGTVLRWTRADKYTYAAVKTPLGWFSTSTDKGAAHVPMVMDFETLIEVLAETGSTDLEVATAWEKV